VNGGESDRDAGSGRRPDRDAGSGTVLVLAIASVVIAAGLLLSSLVAVSVARHRAASVADLSALAAASSVHLGSGPACDAARQIADRSAAQLLDCRVVGDVVEVRAGVRPPGRLGELGAATARARAGPSAADQP
jgi:secretion/DNA translocation related TadE-like protein